MASNDLALASDGILLQLAKLRDAHARVVGKGNFSALERCVTEIERLVCNAKPSTELEVFDMKRRQVAEQIFAIPELLEQILLSGLTVRELLKAQQVNKTFFSGISGSQKLLQRMSLVSDSEASWSSVFDWGHFPGFNLEKRSDEGRTWVKGYLFKDGTPTLPQAGSRIRSMLICQPPVFELNARPKCCPVWIDSSVMIRSTSGVTFGDLLDTAVKLKQAHCLCPLTTHYNHNDYGYVEVEVKFKAYISHEVDYEAPGRRQKLEEEWDRMSEENDSKWRAHEARMAPYMKFKREAHENGREIPTFDEWVSIEKQLSEFHTAWPTIAGSERKEQAEGSNA